MCPREHYKGRKTVEYFKLLNQTPPVRVLLAGALAVVQQLVVPHALVYSSTVPLTERPSYLLRNKVFDFVKRGSQRELWRLFYFWASLPFFLSPPIFSQKDGCSCIIDDFSFLFYFLSYYQYQYFTGRTGSSSHCSRTEVFAL